MQLFYIQLALKEAVNRYLTFEWKTEREQDLTSHQTRYRLYRGQVFTGQKTQPTVSKHCRKIGPKD